MSIGSSIGAGLGKGLTFSAGAIKQAAYERAAQQLYPTQTQFREGAEIQIIPEAQAHITDLPGGGVGGIPPGLEVNAQGFLVRHKRRRRRRLLTCQDKADIAFIVGTLGKGQLASTAISSLLCRGR